MWWLAGRKPLLPCINSIYKHVCTSSYNAPTHTQTYTHTCIAHTHTHTHTHTHSLLPVLNGLLDRPEMSIRIAVGQAVALLFELARETDEEVRQ